MKDEDYAFEQRRQARIDSEEWDVCSPVPWHGKVGTSIPFSRTVDKDPNPRIPLSVGVEQPRWLEVLAWAIVAAAVGLVYWGVS